MNSMQDISFDYINVSSELNKYFKLPNSKLRTYESFVNHGYNEDVRTPFYDKADRDVILKSWLDILYPELHNNEKFISLWLYEKDMLAKVGPLSVMKPLKDRLPDIEDYFKLGQTKGSRVNPLAITRVLAEYSKLRGLTMRSSKNTVEAMKLSTSSGNPYFKKRREVVSSSMPFKITVDCLQILPGGKFAICAIIGWRGQEHGPKDTDVKQRVIWMFPFVVNIAELQLYQPLIQGCQVINLVPAWNGNDYVDVSVTKLFDTKYYKDDIICTDFEKFDQHFNPSLQNSAFEIIKILFKSDPSLECWLRDVFPLKYNLPIYVTNGIIISGAHGMASGSGGTNADETLAHRALQHEAAIYANQNLNLNSMCLGDDGIITYPGIKIDNVINTYCSHGLTMKEEKQSISNTNCVYLRRWYSAFYRIDGICRGVYSTFRAIGRLCAQERWYDSDKWSAEMVALRQLSIIENCKWHPLREKFADWCMKGDKYRLGLDLPGFMDNLSELAISSNDIMPDFLGYTKTIQSNKPDYGINNWWIVKYLRSK